MNIKNIEQKKAVLVTGGFDPLHSGHIEYFKKASYLGDLLIVGVNSNSWLKRKKNFVFMDWNERSLIIKNLSMVDYVISFNDNDDSASDAIEQCLKKYSKIIFANGGDRTDKNIPEINLYKGNHSVEFAFRVGGKEKINSSSKLTNEFLNKGVLNKKIKPWGEFYNIYQDSKSIKVKELRVYPKQGMSFQRHFKRNEIWLVSKGKCLVNFSNKSPDDIETKILETHDSFFVNVESWHQITNPFDEECKIIEIQYGDDTVEEDIERLFYYENNSET